MSRFNFVDVFDSKANVVPRCPVVVAAAAAVIDALPFPPYHAFVSVAAATAPTDVPPLPPTLGFVAASYPKFVSERTVNSIQVN